MRKVIKWAGIIVGGLAALLVLAVGAVYAISAYRFNRSYDIPAETVAIPTDEASIAYGKHVAEIRFCTACHGDDLAGQIEFQDPMIGVIANSNLTAGQGGVGGTLTDEEWVRAIRHGVGPDGKPLLIMPSSTFYNMSDRDVGAVIAYIKSLPPVDKTSPGVHFSLLPRALIVFGQLDIAISAELIDHTASRPPAPEPGVTVAYGEYLTTLCKECHGPGLSGGATPLSSPDEPPALNLTPGGELAGWTVEDFKTTIRTGVTPSGYHLNPEYMPWTIVAKMTDEELEAVFLYLQSVPAKEFGNH